MMSPTLFHELSLNPISGTMYRFTFGLEDTMPQTIQLLLIAVGVANNFSA